MLNFDNYYTKSLKMLMCICTVMSRRGRSTRSNRQSDRKEIGRPPMYNPRQPGYNPPISFKSLSGSAPTYNRDSAVRTKKTTDTNENE